MQDRAAATRTALLSAASELIDEVGVAAAGLNEMIRRAGVSKGALYFHFDSKAQLTDAIERHAHCVIEDMVRRLSVSGGSALVDTAEFAAGLILRLQNDQIFRAGLRVEREQQLATYGHRPTVEQQTRDALRRRVIAGADELRSEVDAATTAEMLGVLVTGFGGLAETDPRVCSIGMFRRLWELLATLVLPHASLAPVIEQLPSAIERSIARHGAAGGNLRSV